MKIVARRLALVFVLALTATASAQMSPELTRQLARVDVALSAMGEFTTNTNGNASTNQTVQLKPSTTIGTLFTLRYIKSPLIGGEFNFSSVRYTQDFTYTSLVPGGSSQVVLGVQNTASEYTFGYVAHARRTYFGVIPFASIGAGSLAFRPTPRGGEGFSNQARAAYYYSVGAEQLAYGNHFGLRASFRQTLALAPDFQTTYLRDHKRAITTEPTVGFFIRF